MAQRHWASAALARPLFVGILLVIQFQDRVAIGCPRRHACRVSNQLKSTLVRILMALVVLSVTACGSSQPRVNHVQVMNQRMQGAWLLQSYRPFTSLDAPMAALVNLQLGQMRVTINGAQITAQGPGAQVVRTYSVLEADDRSATIVVSEPTGASVRVWLAIEGNLLTFHPLDAPWGGEGTLQRL